MKDYNRDAAVYKDAVLAAGVVIELDPEEVVKICRRVARLGVASPARIALELGVFVADDLSRVLLAVPPRREVLAAVARELRRAGLRLPEARLRRAALKVDVKIGRA